MIIHTLRQLYRSLYEHGKHINKRDRFGIQAKIEAVCLEALESALAASLSSPSAKLPHLFLVGIKIETLKALIRTSNEIRLIEDNKYLEFATTLHTIGGMTAKWIQHTKNKTNPRSGDL